MVIQSETTAAAAVTVATYAMELYRVQGYFNGASNRWLQLHDTKSTPAAAAVPLRSWPMYATAPFDWNFQKDLVQLGTGCTFVVSTTQQTYTASADTMSLYVNGDSGLSLDGTSVAGDYTTDDEVLQVWAQAAGKKRLVRLEASDPNSVGPVYVQVHCADVPATDKIRHSFLLDNAASLDKWFGEGYDPSVSVSGTEYKGCTIAISIEQSVYTALGSDDVRIKATYK